MLRNAALAALLFALAACQPATPPSIDGTWRAVLTSPGGELPFTLHIALRNEMESVIESMLAEGKR